MVITVYGLKYNLKGPNIAALNSIVRQHMEESMSQNTHVEVKEKQLVLLAFNLAETIHKLQALDREPRVEILNQALDQLLEGKPVTWSPHFTVRVKGYAARLKRRQALKNKIAKLEGQLAK